MILRHNKKKSEAYEIFCFLISIIVVHKKNCVVKIKWSKCNFVYAFSITRLTNFQFVQNNNRHLTSHCPRHHQTPTMATLGQPCSSWTRGSIPLSKRLPRRRFSGRTTTLTRLTPQAALVQAPPSPSAPRDNSSIQLLTLSRANDLQAEARAMSRAANATVYNPQLIASMYGSQPVKVFSLTLLEVLSWVRIGF